MSLLLGYVKTRLIDIVINIPDTIYSVGEGVVNIVSTVVESVNDELINYNKYVENQHRITGYTLLPASDPFENPQLSHTEKK